jgi:hypothetical protein
VQAVSLPALRLTPPLARSRRVLVYYSWAGAGQAGRTAPGQPLAQGKTWRHLRLRHCQPEVGPLE